MSKQFVKDSEPWRVQFFQCGYSGVSGWPGWRAVVSPANGQGSAFWVNMPDAGEALIKRSEGLPNVMLAEVRVLALFGRTLRSNLLFFA